MAITTGMAIPIIEAPNIAREPRPETLEGPESLPDNANTIKIAPPIIPPITPQNPSNK